jgi:hypothetical protein
MCLAGDLTTAADKYVDYLNSVITVSAAKSFLEGRFTSAEEVAAKAMRTLTEVSQNGFRECFKALRTLAEVSLPRGTALKGLLCK